MKSKYFFISVLVFGPTTLGNFLVKVTMRLRIGNASDQREKYFYMTPEGELYVPPKHNLGTLSNPKRGRAELRWAFDTWKVTNKSVSVNFLKPNEKPGSVEAKMYKMAIALAETVYEKPVAKQEPAAAPEVVKTNQPAAKVSASSPEIDKWHARNAKKKKVVAPNNIGANMEVKNPGLRERLLSAVS